MNIPPLQLTADSTALEQTLAKADKLVSTIVTTYNAEPPKRTVKRVRPDLISIEYLFHARRRLDPPKPMI